MIAIIALDNLFIDKERTLMLQAKSHQKLNEIIKFFIYSCDLLLLSISFKITSHYLQK